MNIDWGLCRECKWWQIQPNAPATNATIGECIEEELQQFVLRVSGGSGCNRFIAVKPGTGGRDQHPPQMPPTR